MIVFLIDADNLSASAWVDEACQTLEGALGSISVRRAYGSAENLKGLSEVLRSWAIRPFVNLSLTKNTTDLALAVDAMELACQTVRPSVVVIGSGDADFVPLVVRLRERGIRMICVSESSKMAQEASRAYDEVILVGSKQGSSALLVQTQDASKIRSAAASTKKPAAKSTPAKKASVKTTPAQKTVVKTVVAKKTIASTLQISVAHILEAAPALRTGQLQPLGEIAKSLHEAKLLGKSAASTKLFNKFPQYFELSPLKQPNQVRYAPPLK